MEKIRAAVIGLGRIGSLLEEDALREKPCTHAGAISANEDCELVAGCDIEEERRRLFAERWASAREISLKKTNDNEKIAVYSDAQEMIRIHKPQILSIATHPDSHCHYCCLASKMNVPVIICEKPLADNIEDARKIVSLTEKKDGPIIIINHERRYSKDYSMAKSILKEGRLGDIISVRAVLYMGRTRKIVNMLWDDGTHLADIVMFLTDSVLKHNKSFGADLEEKSGTAWLEGQLFQNNFAQKHKDKKLSPEKFIPIMFEIGAGRDHLVFEIEFSLENGRLKIGNGVFEVWESAPSPYAENFRSLKNTGEVFEGPTGYFANMLKDAAACVRDPKRSPVSGAADGLRVIEYLDSVKKWKSTVE